MGTAKDASRGPIADMRSILVIPNLSCSIGVRIS